jgi:hypothetical protein
MDMRQAVILSLAPAVLSGCAVGGVASVTFYEPTVANPAPEKETTERGMMQGSYAARLGVQDHSRTYSFAREGVFSVTLQYPRYDLRVFTTPGRFTGSLELGLVFYIPVPMGTGGSQLPYQVRAEFTCKDSAGCVVDPSRTRFTGDAESGAVTSDCSAGPLTAESRAEQDGSWRLMPQAGVVLSCAARASTPLAITLHLGDAVVIGDGTVRAPSVVLRRVVAYDLY